MEYIEYTILLLLNIVANLLPPLFSVVFITVHKRGQWGVHTMRLGYLFFVLCFITLTTRTSFGDTVDNSPANVVQDQGILMELSDVKERLGYIATHAVYVDVQPG